LSVGSKPRNAAGRRHGSVFGGFASGSARCLRALDSESLAAILMGTGEMTDDDEITAWGRRTVTPDKVETWLKKRDAARYGEIDPRHRFRGSPAPTAASKRPHATITPTAFAGAARDHPIPEFSGRRFGREINPSSRRACKAGARRTFLKKKPLPFDPEDCETIYELVDAMKEHGVPWQTHIPRKRIRHIIDFFEDEVLALFAEGELSEYQIAEALDVDRNKVHAMVLRGRRRGDPRAAQRDRIARVKAAQQRRWSWLNRPEFVRRRKLVKRHGAGTKEELLRLRDDDE
jgi:hypothetical protein